MNCERAQDVQAGIVEVMLSSTTYAALRRLRTHSAIKNRQPARNGCAIAAAGGSKIKNGFTLTELMLVVAILGIMAIIGVPYMMNSIRGNRLSTAARSVVSAGRYARSMAVLRQRTVFLHIDLDGGVLLVDESDGSKKGVEKEVEEEEEELSAMDEYMLAEADENEAPADAPEQKANLERKLSNVSIELVEIIGGDSINAGQCTITYFRNGRCTPYTVRIEDDYGDEITLEVDAMATAKAEKL